MTVPLPSLLERLQHSILGSDAAAVAAYLAPHPRLSAEQQVAIYGTGYRIRLLQAIRADYPALLALLGEPAFDHLAQRYIEANPPAHFNLDRYPQAFALFLASHCDDGFAVAAATLESAIADIFMGEDSMPLQAEAFTGLTSERIDGLQLRLRHASQLLRFSYPVNNWLTAWRAGESPERPAAQESFVYVYRHRHEVQRVNLTEPAYLILGQLSMGLTVGQTLDAMLTAYPDQADRITGDIQAWFTQWISQGFFRLP